MILNSTLMQVYVGAAVIGCATDASISLNREYRDTTCKDSNGNREGVAGLKSGSASTSALYAEDGGNFAALFAAWEAGTPVTVKYSTEKSGDTFYSAQAIVTSLESNSSGTEENVTLSANFEFTGSITSGSVA